MKQARAEEIGMDVLLWLAADDERISGFLSATGADGSGLRQQAQDPAFLGFVLDHLLSDERMLLDFAAGAGLRPEDIPAARAALPGGDLPHWT